MRLDHLFQPTDKEVLDSYLTSLRKLTRRRYLAEGKKVIVTTEIVDDDDESVKISKEAKEEFVQKAKAIGEFQNPDWVKQVVNGLKQVGVQGVSSISEAERPITNQEIKQLITLLIDLVSGK